MAMHMHSPLEQFTVKPIYELPTWHGIDLSITNSALFLILATLSVWFFYTLAMRKKSMVPGRLQSTGEVIYQFVQEIVGENAGKEGLKYFPFFFTLFLFIVTLNMLGMIPYSFAPTAHIIVTLGLGATTFIVIFLIGMIKQGPIHFFGHFLPKGIPLWILPLLFVIEMVSFLSRPFSLAIRLAANIGAGHTLMKVMASLVFPMGLLGVLPIAFIVFMTGLEFFVAILQAYVFTLLACLYLGEALGDHEHDDNESAHAHAVLEAEDSVHAPV